MTTTTNTRLGAILLLASAGCVGPVEIAPLPYTHPANPDAPAGAVPTAGALLGPTPGDSPAGGVTGEATPGMTMSHDMGGMKMPADRGDTKADSTAGSYQCPMHSAVRSDKPGKCPICGMRLVKKVTRPKLREAHE
jgi:hypothetical protein